MMDSGMIGKIEKAKRYAEEKDRVVFNQFEVTMRGDNNDHTVRYDQGKWNCTCSYFQSHAVCAHTMGMEMILEKMLLPVSQPAA
mgnify:CR=1 FL=1|jgi:hypothetical protein